MKSLGCLWIAQNLGQFPGNQLFSSHDPAVKTGFRGHPRVAGRLRRVVVPRRCTQHHSRRVMVEAPPRAGPSPPPRTGPFFVPSRSRSAPVGCRRSPTRPSAYVRAPLPYPPRPPSRTLPRPAPRPLLSWWRRDDGVPVARSPLPADGPLGARPPFPGRRTPRPAAVRFPSGDRHPRGPPHGQEIAPGIAPGRACPIRTEGLTNT